MARPLRARANAVNYRETDPVEDLASDDFAEEVRGDRDQMKGARVSAQQQLKQQPSSRRASGGEEELAPTQQRRASARATAAARPQYRCVCLCFVFGFFCPCRACFAFAMQPLLTRGGVGRQWISLATQAGGGASSAQACAHAF
jgi:hypothetical protein